MEIRNTFYFGIKYLRSFCVRTVENIAITSLSSMYIAENSPFKHSTFLYLAFLTFAGWTGCHWLMILSKEFVYSSNSKILARCLFSGLGWHWPMVPNVVSVPALCICIFVFLYFQLLPRCGYARALVGTGRWSRRQWRAAEVHTGQASFLLHLPKQTLACHAIGIFAHFYKYILQFGQIHFATWANMFLSVVHWPGPPSPSLATLTYIFFNAFRQIDFATWVNICWSLDKYATSANIFCNVCRNSVGTPTFSKGFPRIVASKWNILWLRQTHCNLKELWKGSILHDMRLI